ncbi:MAG: serine hydrolase domain-containing protein [Pseudomonadota bacterium]
MAQFSRRTALGLIPAGVGLAACGGRTLTDLPPSNDPAQIVRTLTEGPAGKRAAATGFVLMRNGEILSSAAFGAASGLSQAEQTAGVKLREFKTTTSFRAASISKVATAVIAAILHLEGHLNLDAPVREYLGSELVPDGSMPPITLRMLLSHTSGLSDPEVYWLHHPHSIDEMISTAIAKRHDRGFEYCNFGYSIAATLMERATKERFDRLVRSRFLQMPMDVGFNWSGVTAKTRRRGATLYRETKAGWEVQVDGPSTLTANKPAILLEDGANLLTYTAGQNGTLFSPQGGLRIDLVDLARLAQLLADAPDLTTPVWTLNAAKTNGVHDGRYFTQFGTGVHIHPANESIWPGHTLWGHHGEAYGLYAGAWYAPQLDISFSYCVTGTPETPPKRSRQHPALNTFTEKLMDAVIAAYAASPAAI